MSTNKDIAIAFYEAIKASGIVTLDRIAFDGKSFNTPATGNWLELSFLPNTGLDQSIVSNSILKQGLLQVNVGGKPNTGIIGLQDIAEQVMALFPKNTVLTGTARVSGVPYMGDDLSLDDRTLIPVTIPYSE